MKIKYLILFTFFLVSVSNELKPKEFEYVVISGNFINHVSINNRQIEIQVEEVNSKKLLGTYYSEKDGFYCLFLQKKEKYNFYVTTEGSDVTHYAIIEIPEKTTAFPLLKQKMELKVDTIFGEYLTIHNMFEAQTSLTDQKRILKNYRNLKSRQ